MVRKVWQDKGYNHNIKHTEQTYCLHTVHCQRPLSSYSHTVTSAYKLITNTHWSVAVRRNKQEMHDCNVLLHIFNENVPLLKIQCTIIKIQFANYETLLSKRFLAPTATIGQLEISINSVISSYQWKIIAYILSKTQGSRLKITWEKLVTAGPDLSTFMT